MTDEHRLALRQLDDITEANPSFKVGLGVADDRGGLVVEVSLETAAISRGPGIRLRARESFDLIIGARFPYAHPYVRTRHRRWRGTPHVHWGGQLCLYLAPAVEWNPQDGMFGLVDRLWAWLESAAAGELDPADAPLHPPVNYGVDWTMPQVIVRADVPVGAGKAFVGVALLDRPPEVAGRIDVVGWQTLADTRGAWPANFALAIVMPGVFDWEYPRTVAELYAILDERGLERELITDLLQMGALELGDGKPLVVLIGTPMRRVEGTTLTHLVAWGIPPAKVELLRFRLLRRSEKEDFQKAGETAARLVNDWVGDASLAWCLLREDRPEIVRRREQGSPLEAFRDRRVVIWGCGAIGGPVAEAIARVRPAKLILYDADVVTPGVLVRQPYGDADIGESKAERLAARLAAALPWLDVEGRFGDVLDDPLARDEWADGADIVIDATASVAVAAKLEKVRRHTGEEATTVSLVFGHDATRGMVTVTPPAHPAGPLDLARKAKIALRTKVRRPKTSRPTGFGAFADEFWPETPRTHLFQPEPGCSEPTFTGSQAEAQALAQALLLEAAARLDGDAGAAVFTGLGHAAEQPEPRRIELTFPADIVLEDGVQGYEVRLAPSALEDIKGYIRSNARALDPSFETGGLLFGQRDDTSGIVWVSEVVGPPPDSEASPAEFICGVEGVGLYREEKRARGLGSLAFVGTWHTHPGGGAVPSDKDIRGMSGIVLTSEPLIPRSLLLIVGGDAETPELGAYMFDRRDLKPPHAVRGQAKPVRVPARAVPPRDVGLALSGGGSRALAFHLGCLRALEDRRILDRVFVVSGVSGGSLAAALWAYGEGDFASFDARAVALLRDGLQLDVARRALASPRALATLGAVATAGVAAAGTRMVAAVDAVLTRLPFVTRQQRVIVPPLRRFSSASEALEDVFAKLFPNQTLSGPRRGDVNVVLNACELRTGSAFRFGSRETSCYRYGRVVGDLPVSLAVAASAAYPLFLPALDRKMQFEARDGRLFDQRVVLTDGGVFDNLGTSVLEPGRNPGITVVYESEYIIACDAGRGLLDDSYVPYGFVSRMRRSFESTFRKAQDGARNRLHLYRESGKLRGFVFPYLGQFEHELPLVPVDLPRRDEVVDYPTDFAPMSEETIELLASRGEKLTRLLVDYYCPEL